MNDNDKGDVAPRQSALDARPPNGARADLTRCRAGAARRPTVAGTAPLRVPLRGFGP
jgi:hypothetical protein